MYIHYPSKQGQPIAGSKSYSVSLNATSYRSGIEGIFGNIEVIDEANLTETDQICTNNAAVTIVNRKLTPTNMLVPEAGIVLVFQKHKHKSTCLIDLR